MVMGMAMGMAGFQWMDMVMELVFSLRVVMNLHLLFMGINWR
jgi:hypothetical protein